MEFDTESVDGATGEVAVIRPHGRLTMITTAELRTLVADTVGGGRTHVVVDLSRTEFVDSSGLGALISGLKTARQAGGDLRIAGAGPQVEAVLDLTNLRRVLRPRPDVAGAFAD